MKSDKLYIIFIERKKITKKGYNKFNKVMKQNAIFMNSKGSGTFNPHRLLLNLTDKIT